MFRNIVIGRSLVEPWKLISSSKEEFDQFDVHDTLFTEERFLPSVLVAAGVVKSRNEIRRNKPDLCISLIQPDCFWVKWGKQKIFIIVGE